MPTGTTATPSPAELPILICKACNPPRPMIIKTVKSSVLGRSQKILFACASCDALIEFGPTDGALDGSFTEKRSDP